MAEYAWSSEDAANNGFGDSSFTPPPPIPNARAVFELRPLTTGEILDRTFYLYRANFWLFTGIASVAATASTLTALGQMVYLHLVGQSSLAFGAPPTGTTAGRAASMKSAEAMIAVGLISIAATLLYLVVYSIVQAATTSAVTAIYLGDSTSFGQAFKAVRGRWLRYLGIAFWQIWSALWIFFLLIVLGSVAIGASAAAGGGRFAVIGAGAVLILGSFAGLAYGVVAYIRNSLAVPAAVMEALKVRPSMRRSKQLAASTKGRIFLFGLFLFALYMVAGAIQAPLAFIILRSKSTEQIMLQALQLFIGFFTRTVVGPVGAIGLCLFYIDQRIRKEGFDLEFMLDRSGPATPPLGDLPPSDLPPATTEIPAAS
jgi:hypothetical protein